MEDKKDFRFIKLAGVKELTACGREKIYKLTREGRFPSPRKAGGRSTRWIEHEVLEWIEAQPKAVLGGADCCGIVGSKDRIDQAASKPEKAVAVDVPRKRVTARHKRVGAP